LLEERLTLKKTITFLIIVALILPSLMMFSTSTVKAQGSTSEAQVVSYRSYTAPSNTNLGATAGDLIVVGEVQNVGSNVISNITVQGVGLSSSGQTLATVVSQAFVYDMLPGQKAPFYLDLSIGSSTQGQNLASSVSTFNISVTSVTDTFERQYTGLNIPEGGSTGILDPSTGVYTAVGTIVNNGTQTTGPVWAVISYYDSAGKFLTFNFTNYLSNSLRPGDATRFLAVPVDDTTDLSNQIASFSPTIDSLPGPQSGQPTSTPTNTTPSTSSTPLPILPIVIVIVIVVAAIAALMLLRRRQKLPPPPPPPPTE
jgi:flagellar basal body-associated protein FliL